MAPEKWTSARGETRRFLTNMPSYYLGRPGPTGFGSGSTADQVAAEYDGSGKVVVITGASAGLGKESARVLASRGCTVIMAVRDVAKGQAAADAIRASHPDALLEVLQLELSSLASVKAFTTEYIKSGRPLHVLLCNAGIMALPQFATSAEGHELQFATNHLGHFALTSQLLPLITQTAQEAGSEGRIVVLSSSAHFYGYRNGINFDHLNDPAHYHPFKAYAQSKLANLLFARQLAERLKGKPVAVVACHPGTISTDITQNLPLPTAVINMAARVFRLLIKDLAQGAATQVLLATAPAVVSGEYYADCNLQPSHPHAHDRQQAARLWQASEKMLADAGY